jgi:cytochrome c peroxidase
MIISAIFVMIAGAFAIPGELCAHIVPPEQFHPAAASYRKMAFFLNLNPVSWDLVEEEARIVEEFLSTVDAEAAMQYRAAIDTALRETAPGEGTVPDSGVSRQYAREVFRESTIATARTLLGHLDKAEKTLDSHGAASASLSVARQIWSAFEHEVRYTDAEGHRRVGFAWLEMSSALGSPGLFDVGAVSTDFSAFGASAADLRAYVGANFGPDFQPPGRGKLRPLPGNSATFNPTARVPEKLPPGSNANKQLPRPRQVLNMAERGVNESDTTLIALGDMAFDSSYIFGEPAASLQISCNTCHNKSITNPGFVVPGISKRPGGMDVSNSFFAPHANNGHFDPLDIPDLRGIRFTAPYGRNGRFGSLREFVRNVIVNEFNGPEPDPTLLDGIIAYMIEFDFLPNPFVNPDGSLHESATVEAKRGEEIFQRPFPGMGDRSCATCHIPSSNFLDHRGHDIGTVAGTGPASRDGSMDTPTLLSAAYTQPYFHDGSQPTLEAVNRWFNERFSLGLGEAEIADLTAYVETVGSGVESYEDTIYTLDAELEEFSFFLSAYEYLRDIGKPTLISITFQTVAQEIHAHKWDLQDSAHLPTLNRLAELMERAYMSVNAGDIDEVDRLVAEYRQIYKDNAHHLE